MCDDLDIAAVVPAKAVAGANVNAVTAASATAKPFLMFNILYYSSLSEDIKRNCHLRLNQEAQMHVRIYVFIMECLSWY